MNIGIFGSGIVGRTLGTKLVELGHEVMLGSRDPSKLQEWQAELAGRGHTGTFSQAAAHGEILFNAVNGAGALSALEMAGAPNLGGKILVDVSNPLDFSNGMPPSLFVSNTDSLAEQIQRAFPRARVVKTLNTVNSALMVDPRSLADGDHTAFVSGDDPEAKAKVTEILTDWFGWRDIIDLGDLSSARAAEMLLPIWVRLFMNFNTPKIQIKIVR